VFLQGVAPLYLRVRRGHTSLQAGGGAITQKNIFVPGLG